MGTLLDGVPVALHQHPAACWEFYTSDVDGFQHDAFAAWVESQLPKSYHIVKLKRDASTLLIIVIYAARGAWPSDLRRRTDPLVKLTIVPHSYGRVQLCGHESTSQDCDVQKEASAALIAAALTSVRAWNTTFWMNCSTDDIGSAIIDDIRQNTRPTQ